MQFHSTSRFRCATLVALLATTAGCGGDGASGPAAPPLRLTTTSAAPLAAVVGIVHGITLPAATVAGTLDGASLVAGRIDDSTLAFVVPEGTIAGSHALALTVDGQALSTTLQVTAPVAVSNPDAAVAAVFDGYDAMLRSLDSTYADPARRAAGVDSATVARVGKALRDTLAQLRADIAAASPADRAAIARTLAANAEALAFRAPAGVLAALRGPAGLRARGDVVVTPIGASANLNLASTVCVAGQQCVTALSIFLDGFASSALVVAGMRVGMELVGTTGGPAGRILARVAGAGVVGMFLYSKHLELVDHILVPMIGSVVPDDIGDLRAASTAPASLLAAVQSPMTAGRPAAVNVQVLYRTLTTGDLAQPTGAELAKPYATYLSAWNGIASKIPFLSLPAPVLGAQPARTAQQLAPPAQLALAGVTPSPWTGSASASGDLWNVTLANTRAGQPHDVTLDIRYRPPGMAEQRVTRVVAVQPSAIAASRIVVAPGTPSLSRGGTLRLGATVQDSTGGTIDNVKLSWTSSRTSVARIDTLGTLAGVDTGHTTITVAGAGVQAQVDVHVTAPQYHFYDYGTLGGSYVSIVAVTDLGWIAGNATTADSPGGAPHPFFTKGPGLQLIDPYFRIYAMNQSGVVVGTDGDGHVGAYKWKDGTFTALPGRQPTQPCQFCDVVTGTPIDINATGDVAGVLSYPYPARGVIWPAGGDAVDLPGSIPQSGTAAAKINDRGDILGTVGSPAQVVVWRGGQRIVISDSSSLARPVALGNGGQVAVIIDPAGADPELLYFWENGTLTPTPLGYVYRILDDGRMIGTLRSDYHEVVMWNRGTTTPLVTLPATGGYSLQAVSPGLWLAGQYIAADQKVHAFVMAP